MANILKNCGANRKQPSLRIKVYPRIHIGLLSLHSFAPRMNGGIGFSVGAPMALLDVYASERVEIQDLRQNPMGQDEQAQLTKVVSSFADLHKLTRRVRIEIGGAMRTHAGMGSATALRLGSIEGLARLNGLPVTCDALIRASGRGGTSGIGIHTYFSGGMICDLGRASNGAQYLPSSHASSDKPVLALPMVEMPNWPVLLSIPRTIEPKSQAEEIAFFQRTTPLPAEASFEACYIALFGIYAAACERNYSAFCAGVNEMQNTAWKRAERAEYGDKLSHLEIALRMHGADCVGMSSLGPMLFCFAPPERMVALTDISVALECDTYLTQPANRGREIKKL